MSMAAIPSEICHADVSNCLRLANRGVGKHLLLDDINASWIFDVYCGIRLEGLSDDGDVLRRLGGRQSQRPGAGSFDVPRSTAKLALAMTEDSRLSRRAPARRATTPEFATFWHGPLDPIAYSCLASFAACRARTFSVYSYDDGIDLPPGVEWADARRICPDQSLLSRYLAAASPRSPNSPICSATE